MAADNFDVDFGFEAELDTPTLQPAMTAPVASAVTNLPPPPPKVLDRKKSHFDVHGSAQGLLRRAATSIGATWWEIMMKKKGRGDQLDNPFLQAPPPTDLHYQYAVEILESLGRNHRWGLWGLLLALSGKELIPSGDAEVDLGVIAEPLTVDKTLIVNVADFMVITANAGMMWWGQNPESRGIPGDLSKWATGFYTEFEQTVPGAIERSIQEARASETLREMERLLEEADPDAPENWGYTRLGAALNTISAPPLEEVIASALKKRFRVQFDGAEMIKWLDQVHRGMASVIGRMTSDRRAMFDLLNRQTRAEIMRRSATTQEEMLQKWTTQFKITA